MIIVNNNNTVRSNIQATYNLYSTSGVSAPGYNGLTGFKEWECYMLVKYGDSKNFGIGGDYEYLIELPLYPEDVSESISPNWNTQTVLGRSSPLAAYANTNLKSVTFSLDLHRDLLTGSFTHTTESLREIGGTLETQAAGLQKQSQKGPFNTRSWYTSINKMLQISCYPQYTSQGLIPPTTYFIFGQMILKGFVESYSTVWKKPIINTFYGWNSVTINMACYPDTIISARDMITNKRDGTASTQNTYNTSYPNRVGNSNVMTRTDTLERTNSRSFGAIGGQVTDT